MRDPKFGGNHQTHSFPADKHLPVDSAKVCRMYFESFAYSAEQRRIVKRQHHKRARAWFRKLAEAGH